jgi:hypothetical protein
MLPFTVARKRKAQSRVHLSASGGLAYTEPENRVQVQLEIDYGKLNKEFSAFRTRRSGGCGRNAALPLLYNH